jgi:hypothetical protein
MVNYLATLRGKAKERLRPIVPEIHELQHRVASQQDVQDNLDAFNEAHPNSFHCAVSPRFICIVSKHTLLMCLIICQQSMSPRRGHYESANIGRVIGACLAYGPTSVIVQFPDYFDPIPITVVAFILALVRLFLLIRSIPHANHHTVAVLLGRMVKRVLPEQGAELVTHAGQV